MRHCALFKLKEFSDFDKLHGAILSEYAKIKADLPAIDSITVSANKLKRDRNFDIMIELCAPSESDIMEYINHPIHVEFVKSISDIISGISSATVTDGVSI